VNLSAFLALLTAHLLGDFVAQTDAMAASKRRPGVLLFHAAIHAALAYLLLGRWRLWPVAAAVFIVHGVIDSLKARTRSGPRLFLADQAAHLAAIAGLAALCSPGDPGCWAALLGRPWLSALLIASGAVACIRVPAILIGFWVRPYLEEIHAAPARASSPARGLSTGGRAIGQWERTLIYLLVLLGQPGSIGFLIAAKSVFRFGELSDRRNRMEAEYITIGTLMSFGTALAVAAATAYALRRL
jgi:Protein of unknown function (DUF3307)